MNSIYEQLILPKKPFTFSPDPKTYRVACNISGELAGFHVEATSLEEVFKIVKKGEPKAKTILVLTQ